MAPKSNEHDLEVAIFSSLNLKSKSSLFLQIFYTVNVPLNIFPAYKA